MAGLKPLLKDIADAIRAKSGTAAAIPASEFATKISGFHAINSRFIICNGYIYYGGSVGRGTISFGEGAIDDNSFVIPVTVTCLCTYGMEGRRTENVTIVFD